MNKLKYFCTTMLLMIIILAVNRIDAKAANDFIKKGTPNDPVTINGITFTLVEYEGNYTHSYYEYDNICKLVMHKGKKDYVIDDYVVGNFVTNGKVIYYVHYKELYESYKGIVYKYNIVANKKKVIISGKSYLIKHCNGDYLYYGSFEEGPGFDLYSMNLKTKKKESMGCGYFDIYFVDDRVLLDIIAGVGDNYVESYKLDGTDKKTIITGDLFRIKDSLLYYTEYKYITDKSTGKSKEIYRICLCTATGENKTELTDWIKDYNDYKEIKKGLGL